MRFVFNAEKLLHSQLKKNFYNITLLLSCVPVFSEDMGLNVFTLIKGGKEVWLEKHNINKVTNNNSDKEIGMANFRSWEIKANL